MVDLVGFMLPVTGYVLLVLPYFFSFWFSLTSLSSFLFTHRILLWLSLRDEIGGNDVFPQPKICWYLVSLGGAWELIFCGSALWCYLAVYLSYSCGNLCCCHDLFCYFCLLAAFVVMVLCWLLTLLVTDIGF